MCSLPFGVRFMNSISRPDMTIRGAPAIGVAGAYGLVFAVREKKPSTKEALLTVLKEGKQFMDGARPTAVNLMWATERVLREAESFQSDDYEKEMIRLAQTMADEVRSRDLHNHRTWKSTSGWRRTEQLSFLTMRT